MNSSSSKLLHIFKVSLSCLFLIAGASAAYAQAPTAADPVIIDTLLGPVAETEPVILELLESETMQRLQSIDQAGTVRHFGYTLPYSRHEHCVGVYSLLKHFGAPVEEQVAGLLHDASHTVFSHIADVLFEHNNHEKAYQDEIHDWYLAQTDVKGILEKHGYQVPDINPDQPHFRRLEQDLPNMCADRIEYNLHTAIINGMITQEELMTIIGDLRFEEGDWFFVSAASAEKLGNISIFLTEVHSASEWNHVINKLSADMLRRAMELEMITEDEFHFGKDHEVFAKLENSTDPLIQDLMEKCQDIEQYYEVTSGDIFDYDMRDKFRGIDPYVQQDGNLVRLSSIEPRYAKHYERAKAKITNGSRIRLVNFNK